MMSHANCFTCTFVRWQQIVLVDNAVQVSAPYTLPRLLEGAVFYVNKNHFFFFQFAKVKCHTSSKRQTYLFDTFCQS